MPLKPSVTTGAENLLNTFLYRFPVLKSARTRSQGKVLHVDPKEFSTPLVLVFSGRQVDVLRAWGDETDCTVITYASVLPKLRDRQQFVTLIRSGELKVQGDIQVVQSFVALADLAELDPAELLAPCTGNIVTEGVSKVLRDGVESLYRNFQCQQRYVAETITEEWCMAPDPLEVAWPVGETAAIEYAAESLAKQPEKLKAK